MRTSQLAAFREEAACRTAVLRRLGHIDEEGACAFVCVGVWVCVWVCVC